MKLVGTDFNEVHQEKSERLNIIVPVDKIIKSDNSIALEVGTLTDLIQSNLNGHHP